jgi:hypothetical protein
VIEMIDIAIRRAETAPQRWAGFISYHRDDAASHEAEQLPSGIEPEAQR